MSAFDAALAAVWVVMVPFCICVWIYRRWWEMTAPRRRAIRDAENRRHADEWFRKTLGGGA